MGKTALLVTGSLGLIVVAGVGIYLSQHFRSESVPSAIPTSVEPQVTNLPSSETSHQSLTPADLSGWDSLKPLLGMSLEEVKRVQPTLKCQDTDACPYNCSLPGSEVSLVFTRIQFKGPGCYFNEISQSLKGTIPQTEFTKLFGPSSNISMRLYCGTDTEVPFWGTSDGFKIGMEFQGGDYTTFSLMKADHADRVALKRSTELKAQELEITVPSAAPSRAAGVGEEEVEVEDDSDTDEIDHFQRLKIPDTSKEAGNTAFSMMKAEVELARKQKDSEKASCILFRAHKSMSSMTADSYDEATIQGLKELGFVVVNTHWGTTYKRSLAARVLREYPQTFCARLAALSLAEDLMFFSDGVPESKEARSALKLAIPVLEKALADKDFSPKERLAAHLELAALYTNSDIDLDDQTRRQKLRDVLTKPSTSEFPGIKKLVDLLEPVLAKDIIPDLNPIFDGPCD